MRNQNSLLIVFDRHDIRRRVGQYVPDQVGVAALAGHVQSRLPVFVDGHQRVSHFEQISQLKNQMKILYTSNVETYLLLNNCIDR